MPDHLNPTEWITAKEAAELTGYPVLCLVDVLLRVLFEKRLGE